MGPITKVYENLVIDEAKKSYVKTLSRLFPEIDCRDENIAVFINENKEWFTLHMCDFAGVVVHEESFKYSDF